MSRQSLFKFPELVDELRKKKALPGRPSPAMTPVHYAGGKIYFFKVDGKQGKLRVYGRCGDRHEQRVPVDFAKKAATNEAWALACSIIETDSRDRKK